MRSQVWVPLAVIPWLYPIFFSVFPIQIDIYNTRANTMLMVIVLLFNWNHVIILSVNISHPLVCKQIHIDWWEFTIEFVCFLLFLEKKKTAPVGMKKIAGLAGTALRYWWRSGVAEGLRLLTSSFKISLVRNKQWWSNILYSNQPSFSILWPSYLVPLWQKVKIKAYHLCP